MSTLRFCRRVLLSCVTCWTVWTLGLHFADPCYSIPLSDSDVTAWTAVLSMIHPSPEPFKISWSNVKDLLLVAHKYDMPCVTGECKLPPSDRLSVTGSAAAP
jgi:hypothetical protein